MPSLLRKLALFALLALFAPSLSFASDSVFVQIRNSKLRSQPSAWSSQVASVSYGDELTKLEETGSWIKAKTAKGQIGYVPTSSVTTRKVVLKGNTQAVSSASGNPDIVLAGKGFTKEVEESFKASSNLDFSAVDAMERVKVADSDAKAFAKSGKLNG